MGEGEREGEGRKGGDGEGGGGGDDEIKDVYKSEYEETVSASGEGVCPRRAESVVFIAT